MSEVGCEEIQKESEMFLGQCKHCGHIGPCTLEGPHLTHFIWLMELLLLPLVRQTIITNYFCFGPPQTSKVISFNASESISGLEHLADFHSWDEGWRGGSGDSQNIFALPLTMSGKIESVGEEFGRGLRYATFLTLKPLTSFFLFPRLPALVPLSPLRSRPQHLMEEARAMRASTCKHLAGSFIQLIGNKLLSGRDGNSGTRFREVRQVEIVGFSPWRLFDSALFLFAPCIGACMLARELPGEEAASMFAVLPHTHASFFKMGMSVLLCNCVCVRMHTHIHTQLGTSPPQKVTVCFL